MQNQNPQKRGENFSLIGEKTPQKISGLAYTVSACFFFLVAFLIGAFAGEGASADPSPDWYLYLGYLAAPIAFALLAVWYFAYTKTSVASFVKAQCCKPKYYLIALLMQIGLFSLGELNGLFLRFLQHFGYQGTPIQLPGMDGVGFLGVFLTVAVVPAIMEEFFFRGILQEGMRSFPLVGQLLLCGGLFALYHQNPAQTVYQFICGVAFSLIAVKSGSFLPTVLSHFINNGVILVLYKLGITSYPLPMYVIMLILSALCLVGTTVYMLAFDRQKEEKTQEKHSGYGQFFACAAVGIFVFAFSWLATLFMGY